MPGFARTFIVTPLGGAGYAFVFAGRALREMFRSPFELKETARQLYEIGWRSLPLIAVSGFAVGIVLSMQTRASLERFGAEALIPAALALALVRETGPLVVGLLMSGRGGEVLIGQVVLEALDLVADCTKRTVTPRHPEGPTLALR